ncbi:hypothetical protein LCGC14_2569070 [marine sediment metagenome]|uniref:Uncharacterized protein n=1 Tax=marine sediment metagenome TaxID=412755 RepID=A0A0F9AI73_9ZZZZ
MCEICDDIDREDVGCDDEPSCICHESEASCQPSTTDASPSIPLVHPTIFSPVPVFWPVGAGDIGETVSDPDDPNYQLLVDTHDVMSPGRMDKLMREFFEHLMKKCQRKNKAYAETDATSDALNNFREAAEDFGISKLTYAMILQGKHYRAWKTFVRTGEAPDKAFRILGDIIVYAMLMYCIGIDEGKWKHEQEVLEDDD